MTDFDNLRGPDGLFPADIARIIDNADPEKTRMLARIGKAVIDHDRYLSAMEWLEDVYSEYDASREATCGILHGEPGVGKSTILRKFVDSRGGPFETSKGTVRPVIRVVTPSNPTPGQIFDTLLAALGAAPFCVGSPSDRKAAVIRQLQLQSVRLVIFDEFTHVVEDRSEKFTKKAAREIKEFLSEKLCQVVFAGTEELDRLHQLYPQIKRRSGGDFLLTPFDWEEPRDRAEWKDVVELVDDTMLLKPQMALAEDRMAKKLHQASAGNLDNLMKLLFRATALAYDEGDKQIAQDILASAFERMRRGSKADNPFGTPRLRNRRPRLVDPVEDQELSSLSKRPRADRDSFAKA